VLGVTAVAPSLEQAIRKAYQAVDKIHFEGAHFRTDIGAKGLARSLTAGETSRG
jgi:phosphoribosylamine--glycine ligase